MNKKLLIPYKIYSKTEHPVPYTYVIKGVNQCLYYFGSKHSYDPNDSQFEKIKEFFKSFLQETNKKSCMVLIEGGARKILKNETEAILNGAEMGFMAHLADLEEIPSWSPEIPDKLRFIKLLENFSKEEIAYHDFTSICHQWNTMTRKPNFEEYVNGFLKNNQKNIGWDDFDFSLKHMILIHKELFSGEFDRNDKQFFYDIINPTIEKSIINKVSRADDSGLRDLYILDQIERLWKQSKNIFIIYGSSHAVMQEPVLRSLS